MKTFVKLMMSMICMGVLGTFINNSSAGSFPQDPNCDKLPVVTCCQPDGRLYCDENGMVENSCGARVQACQNNSCKPTGGEFGAYCSDTSVCKDNGARSCLDAQRVKNNCREVTESCTSDQVCTGGTCKPKGDVDCSYSCNQWGYLSNKCGGEIMCKFGCDGSTNTCTPGKCEGVKATQRICSPWGDIDNGCGERVQDCPDDNKCYSDKDTNSCTCGKPGDKSFNSYQCQDSVWKKVGACGSLTAPLSNSYSNGAFVCAVSQPVSVCMAKPVDHPWNKYQCTDQGTWKNLIGEKCPTANYMSSSVYAPGDVVCLAASKPGNNCVVSNGNNRIGDKIFIDNNKDGLQDTNTANDGVGEMIVELRSCPDLSTNSTVPANYTGALVRTTVAAHKGEYGFENVPTGKYYIHFRLRKGVLSWTSQGVGGDRNKDSDVDPSTDKTKCFQIGANEINLGIDAGVVLPDNVKKCGSLTVSPGVSHVSDNPRRFDGAGNEYKVGNYASLRPVMENPYIGDPGYVNFLCGGIGNDSIPGEGFKISVFDDKGKELQMIPNQRNDYNFTRPGNYKVVCSYGGHTYEYCKKDIRIQGNAKLGTYVWEDTNKDGLMQTRGKDGIGQVVLKLYACDASVHGLIRPDLPNRNMPDSYQGTYLASTITDSQGRYQFDNLNPQLLYYVQMDTLPQGYVGPTIQYKDGYSTHPITNSNLNETKLTGTRGWRSTCEYIEDFVDIGLIKGDVLDIQIVKSVDKSEIYNTGNKEVNWTLQYKNNGPFVAKNVSIEDQLPSQFELVTSSLPASSTQNIGLFTLLRWEIGDLAVGQEKTITLKTRYRGSNTFSGTLVNRTVIKTNSIETNFSNNTGEAQIKIIKVPNDTVDVTVTKNPPTTTIPNTTGQLFTWTINAINTGNTTATNVVLRDTLPATMEFVSTSGEVAPISTGQVTVWNIGTLAKGQIKTVTITARYRGGLSSGTPMTNRVMIIADNDSNLTNNEDTATITLINDNQVINLLSCVSLTTTTVQVNGGYNIDYNCQGNNATSWKVSIYSGTTLIRTAANSIGTITGMPEGNYRAECEVNSQTGSYGPVNYQVNQYYYLDTNLACAYKGSGADRCAPQSNLPSPRLNVMIPLSAVVSLPTPVPYCTVAQASQTCSAASAKDFIIIRTNNTCTNTAVKVGLNGKIGDFVWDDTNKNGQQDTNEVGAAGVPVNLYNCTNINAPVLLKSTSTTAGGAYLFEGLTLSGDYLVEFVKPTIAGYTVEFSPYLQGSDITKDSDANPNNLNRSRCFKLDTSSKLDIDAGIIKRPTIPLCDPTKVTCEPGTTYIFCGDGAVNNGEQCDDGNRVDGDGCSSSCRTTIRPPSTLTGATITKPKGVTCGMIDPPDVMIGEFVPFWWSYDNKNDVVTVQSCASIDAKTADRTKTYILGGGIDDSEYGQRCEFFLSNSQNQRGNTIVKRCDLKQRFESSPLLDTYLNRASDVVRTSYAGAIGASYITPMHRGTGKFDKLGEYQIVWDNINYHTCNRKETTYVTNGVSTTEVTYERSATRFSSNTSCSMNITVSKPYMTQANGLSATREDAEIMNDIIGLDGRSIKNLTTTVSTNSNSDFRGSENVKFLVNDFVILYSALATENISNDNDMPMGGKKVPNDEIYVYEGNTTISNFDPALGVNNKTIIVKNGDLTILGNAKNGILAVVPNGNIYARFNSAGERYNTPIKQIIEGVLISGKGFKSDIVRNNNLGNTWVFGGNLQVVGGVINLNETAGQINDLKNGRRSNLFGWFNGANSRLEIIKNGSALNITTDLLSIRRLPGITRLLTDLQTSR